MTEDKWSRLTVAVPSVTRTIDCFARVNGEVKRMLREEMVHMHDVSVLKDKPKGQRWHRGAKVS